MWWRNEEFVEQAICLRHKLEPQQGDGFNLPNFTILFFLGGVVNVSFCSETRQD